MTDFRLLARVFTQAGDAAGARLLETALLQRLAPYSPRPLAEPEPCWKEPGGFGHFLELGPADVNTFDTLLALAGEGWQVNRDEECDAVWNPAPGKAFLLPEVIWAHILLIRPPPDEAPAR